MFICPRCKKNYNKLCSVGRWECMWHGSLENFDNYTKRWKCCGGVFNSTGCKPCDHGPFHTPIDAISHFRCLLRAGETIDASALPGLQVFEDKPWRLVFCKAISSQTPISEPDKQNKA